MRRASRYVLGAALLIIISAGVTVYLTKYLPRSPKPDETTVELSEPEQVLSPSQLIAEPQQTTVSVTLAVHEKSTTDAVRVQYRYEEVSYPAWRPGSTRVAEAQPITDKGGFIAPLWSPSMLDIAFTKPDFNAVFIAGLAPGRSIRLLTDHERSGAEMEWNIDGMSIRIKDPTGQQLELMVTGEEYPAPDIPVRAYERDSIIYFQPEEGDPVRVSGSRDRFSQPKLSPDETRIAFLGQETGLYIARIDGSGTVAVGKGTHFSWLPDSSGIVYDLPITDGYVPVDGDLWFASADGREKSNITQTPDIVESYPAVAPNGERIVFCAGGQIYAGNFFHQSVR